MDTGAILTIIGLAAAGLGLFWRVGARATETQATASAAVEMAQRAHSRISTEADNVRALQLGHAKTDGKIDNLCDRLDALHDDMKEVKSLLSRITSKS